MLSFRPRLLYLSVFVFIIYTFFGLFTNSVFFVPSASCAQTIAGIKDNQWLINGQVINKDSPAEGLLMNVRMVNVVFEDTSSKIKKYFEEFNPDENIERFTNMISEYVANGINAFTISLQGGYPGYEGAVNSAFNMDGSLRSEYMERVAKVIRESDRHGAVVILSCFYQRQHSHERALSGQQTLRNAISNVVQWIMDQQFANVVLEISNEYAHQGYNNWNDRSRISWIRSWFGVENKSGWPNSVNAQVELIKHAKGISPDLYVSTSGMGDGRIAGPIAEAADFILIHFNHTEINKIPEKIEAIRKYGKPVVCNEDDKLGVKGAKAAYLSVKYGAGWGFMHNKKNQYIPFEFDGTDDDPIVYEKLKFLTTPGNMIDLFKSNQFLNQ